VRIPHSLAFAYGRTDANFVHDDRARRLHLRIVMNRRLAMILGVLVSPACSSPSTTSPSSPPDSPVVATPAIWLQRSSSIDPTVLPLRDQAYLTSGPKKGFMFVCDPRAFSQVGGPGARAQGSWLHAAAKTYDVTKKLFVQGNVYRDDARFTITTTDDARTISGNGLPFGVPSGLFPVQPSDPAAAYDPNPNEITPQTIAFSIPRNPTVDDSPSCTYKRIGITLDGVQLHGPLDSEGRDEMAYQLQDVCSGAAEPGGAYHRHALSECTPHIHERNALVGYALDGFGIFSPYDKDGNELTTADLDECHGTTSQIEWEGRAVTMYHYVLTRDFPYSVSCFRGKPTRNAFPALPGAPVER